MTPEAWIFFGTCVTAIAGLVAALINASKTRKQLAPSKDEGDDAVTMRAMVQTILATQTAQMNLARANSTRIGTLEESHNHIKGTLAESTETLDRLVTDVAGMHEELADMRSEVADIAAGGTQLSRGLQIELAKIRRKVEDHLGEHHDAD